MSSKLISDVLKAGVVLEYFTYDNMTMIELADFYLYNPSHNTTSAWNNELAPAFKFLDIPLAQARFLLLTLKGVVKSLNPRTSYPGFFDPIRSILLLCLLSATVCTVLRFYTKRFIKGSTLR